MKQSIKQNIKSPPEDRKEAKAHQLYDKAAKAAFSKEVVLGLMVKLSFLGEDEIMSAETDFLENEFPSLLVDTSGNVSSSRLFSDRIARIRMKGKPTVFLALEIQSRPDRNMVIRMWHYLAALHDRIAEAGLPEEDRSFSLLGMVVNIGLDYWTCPVSLSGFHEGKRQAFLPTESMPDFSYLIESAEIVTGTEEGRAAYSRLPLRYRELGIYHGMIRRFMEARTIIPGDEKPGRKWWILFCLMTRQEMGVNMDLLRNMAEETDMEEGVTMEEIFHNYRTSLLNEGRKEGIEKGIEKGRMEGHAEGCEEELVRSISKLINKNFNLHQAMDLLDVPEEKRGSYGEKAEALLSSSLQ